MNIEFTTAPNAADINFITQKINEETTDFSSAYTFAFFIRDDAGNIIGGCNGGVVFGCIYTDQLWVSKEYRGKGLGRKLLEAVHEYGKKVGCRIAVLNTMSFQNVRSFYEKLGYIVDFEREGYEQNSCCLFMKKEL